MVSSQLSRCQIIPVEVTSLAVAEMRRFLAGSISIELSATLTVGGRSKPRGNAIALLLLGCGWSHGRTSCVLKVPLAIIVGLSAECAIQVAPAELRMLSAHVSIWSVKPVWLISVA